MNEVEKLKELIEEDFGLEQETNRWYRAVEHDSLVFDSKDGVFYWNSRNIVGGLEEYYKFVRRKKPEKFLPKKPHFTITGDNKKRDKGLVTYPKLVEAFWRNGKNNRKYWYDRLLTDETIDRFKLGYNSGWYSIPIYKNKKFYNIQFRRDEPEKGVYQKYRRSPFLFNSSILRVVNEVIFTEGIVDAILLSQYGFPAVSKNTGAIGWDTNWITYFRDIEKIYLIFDNDSAGRKGMKKGSEVLGTFRCRGYSFEDFDKKGYDIVDFFKDGHTKEEFSRIVNRSVMIY